MALQNRTIVDQRVEAVKRVAAGESVVSVAERFGVTRQSVHGWINRFEADGEAGLVDRSRRPHSSPRKTPDELEQALVAEREKWGFGAKKILRRCQDTDPGAAWPRRSTVDAIFKRNGLVEARRKVKRRLAPVEAVRAIAATVPGEVYTIDVKGQVRMGNGRLCYPITIADPVSRYLLACDAYESITFANAWASLVRVFREWGLPDRLHSDNGVPFGTSGHGRFSMISVRAMKYAVLPTYNRPGHPQDNGGHERMHKTLLEGAMIPPGLDLENQQRKFDEFRYIFNHERPHEGVDLDRPAQRHRRSRRSYPASEPKLTYEPRFEQRLVDARGRINWRGRQVFFSEAFANETIALEPISYTAWRVHYASFVIGTMQDDGSVLL